MGFELFQTFLRSAKMTSDPAGDVTNVTLPGTAISTSLALGVPCCTTTFTFLPLTSIVCISVFNLLISYIVLGILTFRLLPLSWCLVPVLTIGLRVKYIN